ncbi:hypothetical protein PIB30_070825 [Stylosanthes scabra]|uniref:Uncharacterized protein n=1 Tax=Stylosanthes scabra TaxID=79078 RepID=A0ABU6WLZ0_9FABA|nr:hypothetical protein [Stylosanthes scabra]
MEGEEGEEALKGISGSGSSSSSSRCVAKCSDCGNQAKKDCSYSRCRTCCKNKGFHCPTHVRSTWIPVHTRRHKSSPSSSSSPLLPMDHHQQHFLHSHIPKRHKHIPEEFPASMSSMGIFRCVRVRSMDESVNEIAYQTSVNIGGHLFTGLLYDQGPHHHHHQPPPPRSIDYPPHHHHHAHQLQSNNNNNIIVDAPLPHHDQPFLSSSSSSHPLLPLPSPFVRPSMPYYFSSPPSSDYPKP